MNGDLVSFGRNRHSQNGEDGIVGEIMRRLEIESGYFVEFGAWDGIQFSNTYALFEDGWTGCYIEGDPRRYAQLVENVPDARVRKICTFVRPSGPDRLDAILSQACTPPAFELLSIDIDSDDLAVWRGLKHHRPLCVVIEYNPTIPFDVRFENPEGRNWGNAARSICEFADNIGYRLVAVTATNLIFLDGRSKRDSRDIDTVRLDGVAPRLRFFWGYDGTLVQLGAGSSPGAEFYRVPWVGAIRPQPVPAWMRRYDDAGDAYRSVRRRLLAAATVLSHPISAIRILRQRMG